jgi:DNA-binding PucR family transcriptional regulator
VVGVGPVAEDTAGLPAARATAYRAPRVLRTRGGCRVARLAEYDTAHGTNLVETLRAWLDSFGDVIAAAATVYVHPNTFRYRLRRLSQVGGLDLTDPEARFAAMLQLRVLAPPPSS